MKNCAIYSPQMDLDRVASIVRDLYPKHKVEVREKGTHMDVISRKWFRTSRFGLNIMTSQTQPGEFAVMKNGMGNFFAGLPAENAAVQEKLLIQISALNMVIGVETDQEITGPFREALLELADRLNGIVFMGTRELLDSKGRLIMDLDGRSEVDDLVVTAHAGLLDGDLVVTESGRRRKERSERILEEQGIRYNAHLPVRAGDEEITIRSLEETAKRAIAFCITALKGECHGAGESPKDTRSLVNRVIRQYGAEDFFTPKEGEFLKAEAPEHGDIAAYSWGYEAYTVLLWALGYVDQLEYPDRVCDVPEVVSLLQEQENYKGFVKGARMRAKSEILDAADLIYRYNWVCVDSRLKGEQAPGGLDAGVVYERHRALNWLIRYREQEWDEVTTDT
ncbi:hypothetical protein J2T17_004578 [Paenibacillus mucilaginosus]|uniref:DUF4272 domain-containing protein n=1 Tax=Paenibacillus mucilaginosus TaxID=61624 RepID=UPI003D2389EB